MQKNSADAFFRIVADFIFSSILLSIICMDISWIQIFWYMLKYKLFNESSSQFGWNLDDPLEVILSFSESKWSDFQKFISQRNSEVSASKCVSKWRWKIKISSRHFFVLISRQKNMKPEKALLHTASAVLHILRQAALIFSFAVIY